MAETEFKYDVFISYSHKDEEWVVNTLLPALENAGLKVCIDYRDFDAGRPSIVNMEDAVDESRHTVLVLTPNWTNSEWTDFEAVLTQTDDPVGRRQKMIPIMLEECTPPKRVRSLTYVDFMRSDRLGNAWAQLFKALGKPNAPIPISTTQKPDTGSRDTWYLAHPYPMPPNFTGRVAERAMLSKWLNEDAENRLFIIRALGGFGKSALSWHWLSYDVDPAQCPKLVWWSFYEGDASFEHFIEETLKYLKLEVPQGQRPQVDALLKAMQSQKILLSLDGFERVLRAYRSMNAAYQGDDAPAAVPGGEDAALSSATDCVNINAEIFLKNLCSLPNIKSKILMTTRLTPRAVKPRGEFMLGCREIELTAMQKEDAVEFFRKQKIKGTHAEIEAACATFGYHPLSLRLLAGRILKDFENPSDIVVAQKLKIDGDVIQQKHHVLEVSYNSLPPHEQKLLSTIACFRSPVELQTLQAIAENKDNLDADLHDLIERGLLHHTTRLVSNHTVSTFDLHPIVRRYAYERLTTSDRTAAHISLRDYFSAVYVPERPQTLDDFAPLIELYHHTAQAGELDKAFELFRDRLSRHLYYQIGAYQTIKELLQVLFLDGENKPPRLIDESAQAWVSNSLANAYSLNGQPLRAIPLFEQHNKLCEKQNNKNNLAIGLVNQVDDQCGLWNEAKKTLEAAYAFFDKEKVLAAQSVVTAYSALGELLSVRELAQSPTRNRKSAIMYAKHALEFAEEDAHTSYHEREFIRAHWLLGAAYRFEGKLDLSEQHLIEALTRGRAIDMVDHEADILLDLARLRYDQKNYEESRSLADEALLITKRCSYVLQGADVNLFLAQYALEQEKEKAKAKEYAETALKLAYCDGPPYYYKVAYHEAERMLEKLA